jgi:flagellar basal-body rod modification protein FlgD
MSAVQGFDNLYDLTHESEVRKVSYNSSSGSSVVSEGDSKLFKVQKDEMGKDSFLNLLVAQLRYQDPLNPAEDTQFVAQLAQFSQLEFTQNSTQAISSLASSMQAFMDMQTLQAQSITNASATPLLGKDVRVMEAGFNYKGSGGKEFDIHLTDGNRYGTVVIKDSEGRTVAELEVAAESSKGGDIKVKWDGKDTKTNEPVLGGEYTLEVLDATCTKNVGYAYKDGTVSGVSFSASGAGLTIDGTQYGLGYLVSVEGDRSGNTGDGSNKQNYNVSEDVVKKIASIMSCKDSKGAVEMIADVLGVEEDDEEISKVIEILNKDGATDENMIKQLANLLGQKDEDYAEMIKKVKDILG